MFNKKYRKALKILDDEIEFMESMEESNSSLARSVKNDDNLVDFHSAEAKMYLRMCTELKYLKRKILTEIGP